MTSIDLRLVISSLLITILRECSATSRLPSRRSALRDLDAPCALPILGSYRSDVYSRRLLTTCAEFDQVNSIAIERWCRLPDLSYPFDTTRDNRLVCRRTDPNPSSRGRDTSRNQTDDVDFGTM